MCTEVMFHNLVGLFLFSPAVWDGQGETQIKA